MNVPVSHLLVSPTLDCPAACSYCYSSPRKGVMQDDVLEAIIDWQKGIENPYLHITFHGGEPLMAGAAFFRKAFSLFRQEFSERKVQFIVQSNLWLLDEELCELFSEYHCAVGTSLDGPQQINDRQRGKGYFVKTMAGIELARRYGLPVGCICTFTRQSAPFAREIYDFFAANHLDFSIHPAVDIYGGKESSDWCIDVVDYSNLLLELLDIYLSNKYDINLRTLDMICRNVTHGCSELCTFSECLGNHIAVAPDGSVYPCQRFMGHPRFSMGNVLAARPLDVTSSAVWQQMEQRSRQVHESCEDCIHLNYCRGGCPYQAIYQMNGELSFGTRDVYCQAYRTVFDQIIQRAIDELFSEKNIDSIIRRPEAEKGLFREGALLSLLND